MWPFDKCECGLSPRDKMNRKLKEMSKSPDFSGLNNNIHEEKQEPPSELCLSVLTDDQSLRYFVGEWKM